MADHISPVVVCDNSDPSEQVTEDKVKTGDSPEQDKEIKSLQVIRGKSESQVRVGQDRENRGNPHDQDKEPKSVSIIPFHVLSLFFLFRTVSHYSELSNDVKTQSEDNRCQIEHCNKVAFDFEDSSW